jgi:hypothetical protein
MIEEIQISRIVDALMAAIGKGKDYVIKRGARKKLGEAIRELVKITPDTDLASANIAIAKAAGIINTDLFTAERLLHTVNAKAASVAKGTKGLVGFKAVKSVSKKAAPVVSRKVKASPVSGKSAASKSGKNMRNYSP